MTKLLVVLNIILILLVGLVLFNQAKLQAVMVHGLKSQHHYFATTEDGRIIPLLPLSSAELSHEKLLSWVNQAVIETLSFNASGYRESLISASRNYTKTGWQSFTVWLQDQRIIYLMDAGGYGTVQAKVISKPKILEKKLTSARYTWVVDMTIELLLDDQKSKYNVQIVIVRVPRLEADNGIGIEKLTFTELRDD